MTDKVTVHLNMYGHISGTVFHTEHHTPPSQGSTTTGEPRLTQVDRDIAELFGLKECSVCIRRRYIENNLVDGSVAFLGTTNDGQAILYVEGQRLTMYPGHIALPTDETATGWTVNQLDDKLIEMLQKSDKRN